MTNTPKDATMQNELEILAWNPKTGTYVYIPWNTFWGVE